MALQPPDFPVFPLSQLERDSESFTDDLLKDVYIILMTVTDDEFNAVMHFSEPLNETYSGPVETSANGAVFFLGKYGRYKVAIAKTLAGRQEIPTMIPKLVGVIKAARYIICVGMCGGLEDKDSGKTELGDVVVSKMIYMIEQVHDTPTGDKLRFDTHKVENQVFCIPAQNFALKRREGENVKVYVDAIVSEKVVLNNPRSKQQITTQIPKALGYEMEGACIVSTLSTIKYAVPQFNAPEVIVIKGIADWCDGKETSRIWQPFASYAAANFIHERMKASVGLQIKTADGLSVQEPMLSESSSLDVIDGPPHLIPARPLLDQAAMTNTPYDIFLSFFGELADPLGKEPTFTTVTGFLIGRKLIEMPKLNSIKSKHNLDDNMRGREVAQLLCEKLDNCDDTAEAKECLRSICDIFEKREVADEKLRKIAAKIRSKI